MNESFDLSVTNLGAEEKPPVAAFCKALSNTPSICIQSITLYGSAARDDYRPGKSDINLLIVLERIDVSILKCVLEPVAQGRRYSISPFFITEQNLRSSADVFPVKYLAMQELYQVLMGRDVLRNIEISRQHLRLRCEQEIKNLLLRLRRHYIMGSGQGLTEMMSRMIGSFLETLRAVLSLTQEGLPSREEVVNVAAKTFEFDAEILRDVRGLRDLNVSLSREQAEQLYDKFMAIVDKTAQITDKMN